METNVPTMVTNPGPLLPAVYIVALAVMLYSLICAFLAGLVAYMFIKYDRRTNYICLCATAQVVACLASLGEQIYYVACQRSIKFEEYESAHKSPPDFIVVFAPVPRLRQVFFCIQFYTYTVQSLLVLFWSYGLLKGIWGAKRRPASTASNLSIQIRSFRVPSALIARIVILVVPFAPLVLVFDEPLRRKLGVVPTVIWFDFGLCVPLFMAWFLMALVLYKVSRTTKSMMNLMSQKPAYDRWVNVRFFAAFVLISAVEILVVLYQVLHARTLDELAASNAGPDYTSGRAIGDILGSIPGVTPAVFTFLIWGTTANFRKQYKIMFRKFRAFLCCTGSRDRSDAESQQDTLVATTASCTFKSAAWSESTINNTSIGGQSEKSPETSSIQEPTRPDSALKVPQLEVHRKDSFTVERE